MSTPEEKTPFDGLRVLTLESRLAGPIADLIARQGGVPVSAPALREVPIEDNPEALRFADRLMAGEFDMVIFLTGVGARYLAQAIETRHPREAWTAPLARLTVVVRGPKPMVPLREFRVRVDIQAPEPNTWHEVLGALDERRPVAGLRVAVQEYGKENPELIAGLRERGAEVARVPVYRWALPEDVGPLRRGIAEIADGQVGAVLFTSAQQVEHMLAVAAEEGREADLRSALAGRTVVGSVGPTTSETLRGHGLPVDIEPEHPKMGPLVVAVAERWRGVPKARGAGQGA